MTFKKIECSKCTATIGDVDLAIDAGWEPSFIDGEDDFHAGAPDTGTPLCPKCVAKCKVMDHDLVYPQAGTKCPGSIDWKV